MQDRVIARKGAKAAGFRAFFSLLLPLFVLLSPGGARAEEGRGYFEINSGYKTGDFGTPTRTSLFSIGAAVGHVTPTWDASVSLPLLFLSGSGDDQGGMMNMNAGAGDVVLRAGRVLVREGDAGFSIDAALAIKLPTADEKDGLGTGETDYGAFLNAHKRFDAFKLSLLSGYIKVGDPGSIDYNDLVLYGLGISRIFGNTELFASFEGRRATVPGSDDPREVTAGFFHVLSGDYALKGGAFRGLNKGGPDFGLNLGLVRWF
jgi:hypothetical protein